MIYGDAMKEEINLDEIKEFKEEYDLDKNNKGIEEDIRKWGIKKASSLNSSKDDYKFEFNIEVPEVKIYNQLDSHQCNIYAFLRVVKDILRNNSKLDVDKINFSANYIEFFDKMEKANVCYNELIKCRKLTLDIINKTVNHYIGTYGTFHMCREIVNKYGLVMTKQMKEVNGNFRNDLTMEMFRDKVKTDALGLLNLRFRHQREEKKKELMYEVYQFLSRIYGEVPISFDFEGIELTPLEFKERYLKNYLDDFVTLTTIDKEDLFNSYSFIPNVYLNDNERIIRVTKEKMRNTIVDQLKDGVSVWFSSEESTTLDYDDNILDDKINDIYNLLNINNVSRKRKMNLDIINYDHAMCITGALVKGREIKQFKVDNSFGYHGKFKGQLIMTNSFLDNCVITAIVDKKYLD